MFIKHRVGGNKQLILNLQAFCRKELIVIQKVTRGPSAALLPVPAVLVTSRLEGSEPNIITIAWTGVMSSEPPVVYISVRPVGRHSYRLIKDSGSMLSTYLRPIRLRWWTTAGWLQEKMLISLRKQG